jgi:hypothetical protein
MRQPIKGLNRALDLVWRKSHPTRRRLTDPAFAGSVSPYPAGLQSARVALAPAFHSALEERSLKNQPAAVV